MATGAALGLHWRMFVNEWTLLVDMALVADIIAARQAAHLAHRRCPMRVVAVHALHQTLVDAVVIRFGEIGFGGCVTSVTQLGLLLDEQGLFFFGVMG